MSGGAPCVRRGPPRAHAVVRAEPGPPGRGAHLQGHTGGGQGNYSIVVGGKRRVRGAVLGGPGLAVRDCFTGSPQQASLPPSIFSRPLSALEPQHPPPAQTLGSSPLVKQSQKSPCSSHTAACTPHASSCPPVTMLISCGHCHKSPHTV